MLHPNFPRLLPVPRSRPASLSLVSWDSPPPGGPDAKSCPGQWHPSPFLGEPEMDQAQGSPLRVPISCQPEAPSHPGVPQGLLLTQRDCSRALPRALEHRPSLSILQNRLPGLWIESDWYSQGGFSCWAWPGPEERWAAVSSRCHPAASQDIPRRFQPSTLLSK